MISHAMNKNDDRATAAVKLAATRVGAREADMTGFYVAGDVWDADDAEGLADLLVEAWREAAVN